MGTHVMVDLETFGVGNNAAIVSIGAVKFNGKDILDKFHVGVDPDSCQQYGLDITAGTVLWWMGPERRTALDEWLALEKHDLRDALDGFSTWYEITGEIPFDVPSDQSHLALPIWGNGATFDNVILKNAYQRTGLEYPCAFYHDWCYRTLKSVCKDVKLERVGTHHNALGDAESQARHLQKICAQLGIEL